MNDLNSHEDDQRGGRRRCTTHEGENHVVERKMDWSGDFHSKCCDGQRNE